MNNEEAIETIKIAKAEVEWDYPMDYQIAFDKAIEVLEKQIPKKPNTFDNWWVCPFCDSYLRMENYCHVCGQRLDWSDEDDI